MRSLYCLFAFLVVVGGVLLPGCFGGNKNGSPPDGGLPDVLAPGVSIGDGGTRRFTVGGTVIGLNGTGLVLVGDKVEPVTVSPATNGGPVSFTFQTAVPSGFPYVVAVQTQPSNPSQNCVVMGGTGKVGTANVRNIVVNCSTDTFVVGGNATGVEGRVILTDNGGDPITVTANGSFAFPTAIPSGGAFAVAVRGNPQFPSETCSVTNGSGTVTAGNITTVAVACVPNVFNVGGTVVGLTGTGLVLTDSGTDVLHISANGAFTFGAPVTSGSTFAVAIKSQPSGQVCILSGASGQVASSDVTSVVVNCSTNTFTVGGNVSGLAGSGLVLANTNGNVNIGSNGEFSFPPQADGSAYNVTIASQPSNPTQTCAITGGSGTIATANITGVQVTCATGSFTVGGAVSGLLPGMSVVVEDNGGDLLNIGQDSSFTFATSLASGDSYHVTATASSAQEDCQVSAGDGIVGTSDVTNVAVTCSPVYTISVTITDFAGDLGGNTLTLSDGIDTTPVNVTGNTFITFATTVPAGTYTLTESLSGSCGGVSCNFADCGDGGAPLIGVALVTNGVTVQVAPLSTTTTTVTVGPNGNACLVCRGSVSCCDDPCSNGCPVATFCSATICPQNANKCCGGSICG